MVPRDCAAKEKSVTVNTVESLLLSLLRKKKKKKHNKYLKPR